MDISVVVPLYNEEESLPHLIEWIERVMNENNFSYEVLLIDDGSKDNSWSVIESLMERNPNVKGVKFRRNYGKSAALNVGFERVNGDVVITMDADLQDSPDEIPELYDMIKTKGYDLVSGWKKKRYDSKLMKNLPSKLYNATTRWLSGIKLHDFNCGLKAYRKAVVKSIEVYGEMHRYIPIIAKWAGFSKIGEKVVQHRKREFGESKFGMNRFVNGYLDLMSIMFVSKFGKKPMHFFGLLGSVMFLLGIISAAVLGVQKLIAVCNNEAMRLVTDSPYFYLALITMVIGCQLFLTGFIAEMIGRNSPNRNSYLIEKDIEK
ncbi:MAG: glycosyltransferase family 2 protein [Bacteroidales bacterium]|jgi:glycosyltransferase involved in cell wall biosynthesis|nr:glycosyltransferase family 2 protein [Bacteroidales bacterium]MEE0881839.1 glycosyltransferase family 2 protein [Bacteroidales bacterium]MEE1119230.1 glycosyltransferase family 2 protein [Bacteroidales bacterium]MEE1220513.1 glycosyltransferase family 2 protein [Bacteroidales bacterium]MEE1251569.1 glycosyltransferase family 2 protein [Bacteroidales bacterium]